MSVALGDWLLGDGAALPTVAALLEGYQQACGRAGIPAQRLFFGSVVPNPQAAGVAAIYEAGLGSRELSIGHAEFERLSRDLNSPIRTILGGQRRLRARLGSGQDLGMDDLRELAEAGYQDYVGFAATIRGKIGGGLLLASRDPAGFSDGQIEALERAMPAFSAVVYLLIQRQVQRTLLKAYLGSDAGARVDEGQAQRGRSTTLRGAFLLSDMRGFTAFAADHRRDEVLDVLNGLFEPLVRSIQAEGGQVLKFMGDGLLAVFDGSDRGATCEAALRAARSAQRALRQIRREQPQRTTPLVGIGLHYGEVAYGNIGAPGRLDFTVIGSAVNIAARIEALCGSQSQPILMSEAVALAVGETEGCLGAFELKGVPEPVPVFACGLSPQAKAGQA